MPIPLSFFDLSEKLGREPRPNELSHEERQHLQKCMRENMDVAVQSLDIGLALYSIKIMRESVGIVPADIEEKLNSIRRSIAEAKCVQCKCSNPKYQLFRKIKGYYICSEDCFKKMVGHLKWKLNAKDVQKWLNGAGIDKGHAERMIDEYSPSFDNPKPGHMEMDND